MSEFSPSEQQLSPTDRLRNAAENAPRQSTPLVEYRPNPDNPDVPQVRRLDQLEDFRKATDKLPVVVEGAQIGDLIQITGEHINNLLRVIDQPQGLKATDNMTINEARGGYIVQNIEPNQRENALQNLPKQNKVVEVKVGGASGYDPEMRSDYYNLAGEQERERNRQAGYPPQVTEQKPM